MAKDRKAKVEPKRDSKKTKARRNTPTVKDSPSKTAGADSADGVTVLCSPAGGPVHLSDGEVNILAVFRKYLMTPGRMLCLNNTDIGSMKRSLDKLIAAGLLIPEDFKGSYSLTRSGFKAMNELGQPT